VISDSVQLRPRDVVMRASSGQSVVAMWNLAIDCGRRSPSVSSVVIKRITRSDTMPRVRWGILSTSGFALQKVLPAWRGCRHVELAATASRTLVRARAVASALDIARAHGSYEALLADPEVDAVYNPLPNHLHVPWTIKALEAGKHVLCEKPIAMTAAEAQ